MSDGREIIEWLIDVLPPGFEWAGRAIVGAFFLCAAIVAAVAAWIGWNWLIGRMRNGNDDPRP
jgi:hypothetical protein